MKLLDFGMYSTKLALKRYYFLQLICCFVLKGLCHGERQNVLVKAELRL